MPQNANRDWLTYETIFNVPEFRKTNEGLTVGLYVLPRSHVRVFFRDFLDEQLVETLTDAFFPDEPDALAHLAYSNLDWAWKRGQTQVSGDVKGGQERLQVALETAFHRRILPPLDLVTLQREVLAASPAAARLLLESHVVLPYNHLDNDPTSLALGTKPKRTAPRQTLDDEFGWRCWKTTSRSCVMKIDDAVKRAVDEGGWAGRITFGDWEWAGAEASRRAFNGILARNPDLAPDPRDGAAPRWDPRGRYDHRARDGAGSDEANTHEFSIKLGAKFVGVRRDLKGDKQCLESNAVLACLRSDYVASIEDRMRRQGVDPKRDVVVLTELLSITKGRYVPWDMPPEPPARTGAHREWEEEVASRLSNDDSEHDCLLQRRDGIQVRDLRSLRSDCIYIPPISIPFIDTDLETVTPEFFHLGDPAWRHFWRGSWARPLGRAKALLLLRYGLQAINPHAQNYLLEFRPARGAAPPTWSDVGIVPTGRVLIRDLADVALHREIAWAIWAPKGAPPPRAALALDDARTVDELKSAFAKLEHPVLRSEFDEWIEAAIETGTRPESYYDFTGTQLLWQRFSVFPNPGKFGVFRTRMKQNEVTLDRFAHEPRVTPEEWARRYQAPPARGAAGAAAEDARFMKFWKRFLATMNEWGRAHNREYIRTIERELRVNIAIDWSPVCDRGDLRPGGYLQYELGNPRGGDPYVAWEEETIRVVHDFLACPEGQRRIRSYFENGWRSQRSTPGFELQLSPRDGGEEHPVEIVHAAATWTDLTDASGKLYFYDTLIMRVRDPRGEPGIGIWRRVAPEQYVIRDRQGAQHRVAALLAPAIFGSSVAFEDGLRLSASRES